MNTHSASSQDTQAVKLASVAHCADWQQAMRNAVTDVDTLFAELQLPDQYKSAARRAAGLFGLRVPRSYLSRIHPGDMSDPLLRQILPLGAELETSPGFVDDAVGDMASVAGDGLLHKYHGRALLITTGACAVNCRYCFRRHFDYGDQHAGGSHTQIALDRIAADPSLSEIILSGGDPLSLSNARLKLIGKRLDGIKHVRRLRLHSRTPIVLPERVDTGLADWLSRRRARCVVVIHANHARELSNDVTRALARMKAAGALLLNQSVLLAGVNDNVPALVELSETLFEAGVQPYYLHLLDRVRGTHHFEVTEKRAVELMQGAAARLPGYLVPKLAREQAGNPAKSVIGIPAESLAGSHQP